MKHFYCGHCESNDVKEIEHFNGEYVVPENPYNPDDNRGIVVLCNICNEITGFLVLPVGAISRDDDE